MNAMAEAIYNEFQNLLEIRRSKEPTGLAVVFNPQLPKHVRHYMSCQEIKSMALMHPPALLEVIFSGRITDDSHIRELIMFLMDQFSLGDTSHVRTQEFLNALYQRRSELPPGVLSLIDWLERSRAWKPERIEDTHETE